MLSISKYIIKANVTLIKKISNIIIKTANIISIPFKHIKKLIKKTFKPISFIIINLRKTMSNITIKSNNLLKNNKNIKNKEGIYKKM